MQQRALEQQAQNNEDKEEAFDDNLANDPLAFILQKKVAIPLALIIVFFLYHFLGPLKATTLGTTEIANRQLIDVKRALDLPRQSVDDIKQALKYKNYAQLDAELSRVDKNTRDDIVWEQVFQHILDNFSLENGFRTQQFDDWVDATGSAYAYLARGFFTLNKGWQARGNNWSSKTSDAQFDSFQELLEWAADDFETVKAIDPNILPLYAGLISASYGYKALDTHNIYIQAIAVNPAGYQYHKSYSNYLKPKWFGSKSEWQTFNDEMQSRIALNPMLATIDADLLAEKARTAMQAGRITACIKHYNTIFEYGIRAKWLRNRAWCLMKDGQYDASLSDVNLSLQLQSSKKAMQIKRYSEYKNR